jgi:hypothetical protein
MDSDIISFNKYEVVFRGFISEASLITEDDAYTTFAFDENEAADAVHDVNDNRDNPLHDIRVISVKVVPIF